MNRLKVNNLSFALLIVLVSTQFSYSQKTEVNFNAYSGLFSFRGDGSASTSAINFNPYTSPYNYTSIPYGKKSKFSYAFELQGQHLTKKNNIYGLGISFERLATQVRIDFFTQNGFIYTVSPAKGKTFLKNTIVTLNPFIGHRFFYHKVRFDILAGFDMAFCLKSKELGYLTTDEEKDWLAVENNLTKPFIDFRPRIQIKAQIKKFGFLAGYSLGLTNYRTEYDLKAYSNFLRLGLSYQLK